MSKANEFVDRLKRQGYEPVVLSASGQGSLVVLPLGARVLGAFCPSCSENALWVNSAIFDRERFLGQPAWKNFGGERSWVSPEFELFIRDLRQPATSYVVPASFDPGAYRVVRADSREVVLETDADVVSYVSGEKAAVRIIKEVEVLDSAAGSLKYRQNVTLKLLSATTGLKLGLWNLTQLPAGGKILIGTRGKAAVTPYFGQDTRGRVTVGENFISFAIDARESHKIGVKVDAVTGKLGYVRRLGAEQSVFYYRTFVTDPAGPYVDPPWNNLSDTGYAVQCYNDDGQFGDFGEMEYHSPAVGAGTGRLEYRDSSEVEIVVGTAPEVREQCSRRMNMEIEM